VEEIGYFAFAGCPGLRRNVREFLIKHYEFSV
jgi:hypothetical protein